jgi:hypothetical protein
VTPVDAQLSALEALLRALEHERTWAVVGGAFGGVALLAALACWLVWAKPLALGAAWPLAILGGIHLVVGAVDFVQTNAEHRALPDLFREAPHRLDDELAPAATEAVQTTKASRAVDGLLGLAGLALVTRRERLRGVGLGLVVMSLGALVIDSALLEHRQARLALLTTP